MYTSTYHGFQSHKSGHLFQIQHYFDIQICENGNQAGNILENKDLLQVQRLCEMLHYLEWTSHLFVKKQKCIGYLLIAITPVNILPSQSATEHQQLTSCEVLWRASDFHVGTLTNN